MNDFTLNTTDLVPTPQAGTVGTDFLTFAVGGGANVEAQADYAADPQRPTGNLPGMARSNFNNKALRQGTFVAHSLCLWMSQQLVQYIPDDGNDIAWIGEWTSALSQFMLALLPPGPNLGAYLPLAGGTMSGNIQFQSGVSTVLANNTWYYAKDTVGTNRGLIIKSSDNNVYINDGSGVYVYFNGIPATNNNFSWSGKDTTGTARPVIGLLSDNAVHVGSGSAGNIYLDTTAAGGVYFAGNSIYTNNTFINWRDSGGTLRPALGMNATNALLIGSGVTSTTDIYAGGGLSIYLHNNTNALGLLTVNQYTYMNGGGRAYIAGGNDPLLVYADAGYYARIHYTVAGTRDWTAGCSSPGWYSIADESAHAVRWEIDLSGNVHAYGALTVGGAFSCNSIATNYFIDYGAGQVNGGLTVYNSLNVASGNLTVSGGTYAYNGLTVYNSVNIVSGGLSAHQGAWIGDGGNGLTVWNSLNMASGTMTANGPLNCYGHLYAGDFQVGGTGNMWDGGGNWVFWNTNLYLYGQLNADTINCRNVSYSWDFRANGGMYCNYFQSYGTSDFYGITQTHNGLNGWGGFWLQGDFYYYDNMFPVYNDHSIMGVCQRNMHAIFSMNYYTNLRREVAIEVAPIPRVCLALVDAIEPKTYRIITHPNLRDDHGDPLADDRGYPLTEAGMGGTHWGFLYEDINDVMNDRDRKLPNFSGAYADKTGVGVYSPHQLLAVLWQAVRELSEKVEKLEATKH